MAKIVLAVSGGVDSMAMLDMVCRSNNYSSGDIIVAHFDHGIRENSALDAEFVQRKAAEYGVGSRLGKGDLNMQASEAEARAARYDFLSEVAGADGEIWTAHHLDDLVETVAVNLIRGTGWRGLAGLDRPRVRRPFLECAMLGLYEPLDKTTILEYAAKRRLAWREDQTNSSDEYLRNRIRHRMNNSEMSFEQKMRIFELWQVQKKLKREIDSVVTSLLPAKGEEWRRSWFRKLDEMAEATKEQGNKSGPSAAVSDGGWEREIALELLRAGTLSAGISATRPQLENFRQAILNYQPGKYFNLPGDYLVKLGKNGFWL